ncbi:hypothetical protein EAI_02713 [Harpegnathos saltator]|uniref:Uncharacterized protein n=1 Tax=Harpegnathos saltator TaxID=610380 RepID=E2CA69_HARSA|nr:hypothetical protein EAI_02713 [Harpegnathos saltator]
MTTSQSSIKNENLKKDLDNDICMTNSASLKEKSELEILPSPQTEETGASVLWYRGLRQPRQTLAYYTVTLGHVSRAGGLALIAGPRGGSSIKYHVILRLRHATLWDEWQMRNLSLEVPHLGHLANPRDMLALPRVMRGLYPGSTATFRRTRGTKMRSPQIKKPNFSESSDSESRKGGCSNPPKGSPPASTGDFLSEEERGGRMGRDLPAGAISPPPGEREHMDLGGIASGRPSNEGSPSPSTTTSDSGRDYRPHRRIDRVSSPRRITRAATQRGTGTFLGSGVAEGQGTPVPGANKPSPLCKKKMQRESVPKDNQGAHGANRYAGTEKREGVSVERIAGPVVVTDIHLSQGSRYQVRRAGGKALLQPTVVTGMKRGRSSTSGGSTSAVEIAGPNTRGKKGGKNSHDR